MVDITGAQGRIEFKITSLEILATAPTPSEGKIYYDSSLKKIRFYI